MDLLSYDVLEESYSSFTGKKFRRYQASPPLQPLTATRIHVKISGNEFGKITPRTT